MQTVKKIFHLLVNVLLWVLIVVIAFFAVVTFSQKGKGGVARIFGFTPMTVLSDSMSPTFHKDDLIIIKEQDPATFELEDIISFWTVIDGRRAINTHRIVDVYRSGDMVQYITKGDANAVTDSYVVSPAEIIGGYVGTIPLLGSVLALLSTSTGFLVVIVLPILAFFLYQLYRFILLLIELKRATVLEATREAMEQLRREAAVPDSPQAEANQRSGDEYNDGSGDEFNLEGDAGDGDFE